MFAYEIAIIRLTREELEALVKGEVQVVKATTAGVDFYGEGIAPIVRILPPKEG